MNFKRKTIPIEGLENYQISTIAVVYKEEDQQVKKFTAKSGKNIGYQSIFLFNTKDNKRKTYSIHNLMGQTFLGEDRKQLDVYGLPKTELHHIDRNRSNNSIGNLMWVSKRVNSENKGNYANNTSGYKGVYKFRGDRYRAMIKSQKKLYHLGLFENKEDAINAYNKAKKKMCHIIPEITNSNSEIIFS